MQILCQVVVTVAFSLQRLCSQPVCLGLAVGGVGEVDVSLVPPAAPRGRGNPRLVRRWGWWSRKASQAML
jgi:hypothetical protein